MGAKEQQAGVAEVAVLTAWPALCVTYLLSTHYGPRVEPDVKDIITHQVDPVHEARRP